MLKTGEEIVMKVSPEEEGRIIAQSRFDVNGEIFRRGRSGDIMNDERSNGDATSRAIRAQ